MHGLAHHLVQLVVYALAVTLASRVVPGVRVRGFGSALLFAFVLAVLDKLLYTVLVILSLPAIVLSFGLFLLVINAFLFWLADKVVDGVEVDGAGAAFFGSLVSTLISSTALWLLM